VRVGVTVCESGKRERVRLSLVSTDAFRASDARSAIEVCERDRGSK